ncbi:MAG: 6-phosphogluconolactonase, partial [Mycoplasmataceae bacterium]|nr:6-phosphogluconolactonase [Mycoplasmataceae bacterium]
IAFNEPGTSIRSRTHNAPLSKSTINNLVQIFDEKINVPTHVVTMGLRTILAAKKIILITAGAKTAAAVSELMKSRYQRNWPVTALIYHPDVTIYVDLESSSLLENK